jgi:hypothetical protein
MTYKAQFNSQTPPALHYYLNGNQLYTNGIYPTLTMSATACFNVGWNSQNQFGYAQQNPWWYLNTNLVTLWTW